MNKITMQEFLTTIVEFMQNPEGEAEAQKLQELKNRLVIQEYMPMEKKQLLLRIAFIYLKRGQLDAVDIATQKELVRIFFLLLGYVSNLELEAVADYINNETYDILQLSGMLGYIMEFCNVDFSNCCAMLDDMYKFEHLSQILTTLASTGAGEIDHLIDSFESFKQGMTPEFLMSLNRVLAINDPVLQTVREGVDNAGFEALSKIK